MNNKEIVKEFLENREYINNLSDCANFKTLYRFLTEKEVSELARAYRKGSLELYEVEDFKSEYDDFEDEINYINENQNIVLVMVEDEDITYFQFSQKIEVLETNLSKIVEEYLKNWTYFSSDERDGFLDEKISTINDFVQNGFYVLDPKKDKIPKELINDYDINELASCDIIIDASGIEEHLYIYNVYESYKQYKNSLVLVKNE